MRFKHKEKSVNNNTYQFVELEKSHKVELLTSSRKYTILEPYKADIAELLSCGIKKVNIEKIINAKLLSKRESAISTYLLREFIMNTPELSKYFSNYKEYRKNMLQAV